MVAQLVNLLYEDDVNDHHTSCCTVRFFDLLQNVTLCYTRGVYPGGVGGLHSTENM